MRLPFSLEYVPESVKISTCTLVHSLLLLLLLLFSNIDQLFSSYVMHCLIITIKIKQTWSYRVTVTENNQFWNEPIHKINVIPLDPLGTLCGGTAYLILLENSSKHLSPKGAKLGLVAAIAFFIKKL